MDEEGGPGSVTGWQQEEEGRRAARQPATHQQQMGFQRLSLLSFLLQSSFWVCKRLSLRGAFKYNLTFLTLLHFFL